MEMDQELSIPNNSKKLLLILVLVDKTNLFIKFWQSSIKISQEVLTFLSFLT